MIGIRKRIIIANMGMGDIIMFNPVITKKDSPYEADESCLSLIGTRKTTRYKNIEVEYMDLNWNRQKQKYSGFLAQIIQHECDHLSEVQSRIPYPDVFKISAFLLTTSQWYFSFR